MTEHKICIVSAMNGMALTLIPSEDKESKLCVKRLRKEVSQIFKLVKNKSYYIVEHWKTGKVLDVYK